MKKAYLILLATLLVACAVSKKATDSKPTEDGNSVINKEIKTNEVEISTSKEVVKYITEANIKSSMEYLASDELEGRATGTKGIEKAAVFIEN